MKPSKKIAILLSVILVGAGMVIAFFGMVTGGFDLNRLRIGEPVENSYSISERFSGISIRDCEADITLHRTDEKQARLVLQETDKVHHTYQVTQGVLSIERIDDRAWFEHLTLLPPVFRVDLYLPDTAYDTLTVEGASSSIAMPDTLSFETVTLQTVSGDLRASAKVAKTLSLHTVSGSITVENSNAQRVVLSTTSGNIFCDTLQAAQSLESTTTSGNTQLQSVVSGGAFSLKSVSGDLTCTRCDGAEMTLETVSGNVSGSLQSGKIFEANTVSGEISLPSDDRTATQPCRISTTSGDITLSVAA